MVPLWIMRALGVTDGTELLVQTIELPRGSFAKLQPLTDEFATSIADHKATLEAALMHTYTTLSKGDSILLKQDGQEIEMFVLEVQPADAVCIVDTELEVDFAMNVSAESAEIQREIQQAQEASLRVAAEQAASERQAAAEQSAREAAAAAEAACEAQEREAQARREARGDAAAALPAEPAAGEGVTTVLVRMPDGPRISRRFDKAAPLRLVRRWASRRPRPPRCGWSPSSSCPPTRASSPPRTMPSRPSSRRASTRRRPCLSRSRPRTEAGPREGGPAEASTGSSRATTRREAAVRQSPGTLTAGPLRRRGSPCTVIVWSWRELTTTSQVCIKPYPTPQSLKASAFNTPKFTATCACCVGVGAATSARSEPV